MENAKRPNMGEGNVKKLLFKMAMPAVLAQVVNLLYNIVDRIYIGHMPGVGGDALTGVGLFTPILMLITAFAMLCGAGGAPQAGIALGQGNKEKAEKIMGNCFALLMILAGCITIVFALLCEPLLKLFSANASPEIIPYGYIYSLIYILGSVFVLIVMGMNVFITAQGNAKVAMLTTVIGAAINIALDPIFIFGFKMGVAGAALATVISQGVGALWILRFLTSEKSVIKLKKENIKLEKKVILPCLALGISTFVMLSTESVLSI
jgi:putative MATE family efflux protein